MARAYLSEIETGKKPGSVAALKRLAKVLGVDIDDLVAAHKGK
jgi:transcriptional regulator with XRE-family HTH domain